MCKYGEKCTQHENNVIKQGPEAQTNQILVRAQVHQEPKELKDKPVKQTGETGEKR